MTEKEIAVLALRAIWAEVLEKAQRLWTCRHYGAQTSILCEFCDGCGVEDCEQGS